jgi:hypothetical protein
VSRCTCDDCNRRAMDRLLPEGASWHLAWDGKVTRAYLTVAGERVFSRMAKTGDEALLKLRQSVEANISGVVR